MKMNKTIRTFIAIKVNPEPKMVELFQELKSKLADEAIRWVELNNLHLTLRFLGDTTSVQVQEVSRMLDEISNEFQSFKFNLTGIGYFKNKGQPRVLFVNIENDEALKLEAQQIENRVQQLGFEREDREFQPHLTLARIKYIKQKGKFFSLVNGWDNVEIQQVKIEDIVFYQSILYPEGPVYKPIKIVKLGCP